SCRCLAWWPSGVTLARRNAPGAVGHPGTRVAPRPGQGDRIWRTPQAKSGGRTTPGSMSTRTTSLPTGAASSACRASGCVKPLRAQARSSATWSASCAAADFSLAIVFLGISAAHAPRSLARSPIDIGVVGSATCCRRNDVGGPVSDVHIRTLMRAVEIVGGPMELAFRLKVTPSHLSLWLGGLEPCPSHVFLKAVALDPDTALADQPPTPQPPPSRA